MFSCKISSSLKAISFGLKALASLIITDDRGLLSNNLDTSTVRELIKPFLNAAWSLVETKSDFFRSVIHFPVTAPRLISLA